MTYRVLFNPLSCSGRGESNAKMLESALSGDKKVYHDLTEISDLCRFFSELPEGEEVILCGGDGTLNQFINHLHGKIPNVKIYYFATGSGNDFLCDLGVKQGGKPIFLNPYLENLPWVEIKGEKRFFLNGVGFGLDGYCCEEGDRQRSLSEKVVNYTLIALKGVLFAYTPRNATVTVDGVTKRYEKVWLAPAMHGRFYGGGLMIAPGQNRMNEDGLLSVVVAHGVGRAGILCAFPTILFGAHVKLKKVVDVITGKEITVTFDSPCALQIDGETFYDVTSYHTVSGQTVKETTIV